MDKKFLIQEIIRLKQEKNAVILAHYYQNEEIQEIADFIGDSLELSKKAQNTNADVIVFAGVHFMAETAKILNPDKKVVLPDFNAGCSLADGCNPKDFKLFKEKYPDHVVVTYINCSAEIKAMSDLVCTSSNAAKIIGSIPSDKEIIFAPDKNLGSYLKKETQRELILWDGSCVVHEAFSLDKLVEIYNKNPNAKIAAHPESESHILKAAHYIGSTSGIINFIKTDPAAVFIVATEAGILHELSKAVPEKTLIPAPSTEDNTCACSECAFMKVNTLEKLYWCLKNESPEILVNEPLRIEALKPIQRMLELS
ncbi:quinolinate synthase NadA [Flavobacterium johnsoniae]|uniref:Quinolinate synthase n=1 Tax=Flavobacterium johnsoniae (strain ATCC 17061 / DSM 2064 / JCM 8514 / BCRC 14874 / CCUG 350202 / NBRC 14942 / NCIMB 11054 / UW101) TaxID=376686 RepID=A5FCK1_FLAJ1|nr:quinolinate synthase NadA [Flavobacterium johnsoniae]ABQ07063.1 quinolinate synthetase A [Flavobacterium johnsoniae UW101]OXE98783.1 quinolinate synthetase [Flavobacterium johnsoniae UW101]WQG81100.1 quinolinate synthase NadA [Flavobacterium johnsoniae UW101]SHL31659.1 quinolinate synthetase [Flavobacterium johnsoniae]